MRRPVLIITALVVFGVANAHAQSAPAPNLTGTWAQVITTTSVAKLPIIGKVVNRSHYFARVEMRQEGTELTARTEPCLVRVEGDVKRVKTLIPRAMVDAMGPRQRSGRATVDGRVYFPRVTDVLGATLGAPLRDDLPTDADHPAVHDEDHDGHPGVTVRIVGPVDGEVYLVQRSWNALRGELSESGDVIRGLVKWGDEQQVVGASSFLLKTNPDARPHPDPEESWFAMKRIAPSTTCDGIRRNHTRLFEL